MAHPLLEDAQGKQMLLLGNEAIVRGAIEAGVQFVTCYPGTPSSEVPDTFFRISPDADYYFEYSPNEKVALEVGGGAAVAGALTLVTMKHVGVNVAADPLLTLTYTGAPGGLVLLSADDPGCHSSQNEQDNRYYARLAGMPCFEPSTVQETKDMTRDALLLARRTEQPVLLRTTTRINHMRGPVEFGPITPLTDEKPFQRDIRRFVPVPATARVRHPVLLENLESLREEAENSPYNTITGEAEVGVIASGVSRAYLKDVLDEQNWGRRVSVLELGFSYPLPERMVASFLSELDSVLILEELEPVLEEQIRAVAKRHGVDIPVYGKLAPHIVPNGEVLARQLPRVGEYATQTVRRSLGLLLEGAPPEEPPLCESAKDLPMRPPNLCAGCSHRALYYAVRQTFGDDALYSSDIGCYTLGVLPPLSAADFLFCMGSSISSGCGAARATGQQVIGFIGDSTFFHSGITGLVNAVFNNHDILVVIMDNRTTAMTGHQPHPGVDMTIHGENENKVDIEAIVRGCGVEHVSKLSPNNVKKTRKTLEEFKELSGVRVLIAEEPCVLYARRALKKKPGKVACIAEQGAEVEACLEQFACPAHYREGEDVCVDENQCSGCMVCLQITSKIKTRDRS